MSTSSVNDNFRLLLEKEPQSGERNMAIDEALLESTIRSGEGTFRIYRWKVPTISLGYFQATKNDGLPTRFEKLPTVRRITGGGAILHHHEITYSMTIRRDHPMLESPLALYDIVHGWIVDAFARQNISVTSRGKTAKQAKEPFLCFLRSDPRDLMLDSQKIVGSAQRRRKGAILQHGSIVLRASEWAPEVSGVEELAGKPISEERLQTELLHAAASSLRFLKPGDRL